MFSSVKKTSTWHHKIYESPIISECFLLNVHEQTTDFQWKIIAVIWRCETIIHPSAWCYIGATTLACRTKARRQKRVAKTAKRQFRQSQKSEATKRRSNNCAQNFLPRFVKKNLKLDWSQRCLTVLKCKLRNVRINLYFDVDTGHEVIGLWIYWYVGRGGVLVKSTTLNRMVMRSAPALAAT